MQKCKSPVSIDTPTDMETSVYNESPVYVKESPIHGKGLFANRLIKKDEIIGHFQCRPVKDDGAYVLWIDDNGYLVEDQFKYINHSSQANACYYDDFTVVALKNIPADREIFHNYGEDWE